MLILDDAHFLDPGRARRGGRTENVLTVLTFRLGFHPAGSAELRVLADLVARGFELRLLPLSPAGVEQMAAAMGRYAAADVYARKRWRSVLGQSSCWRAQKRSRGRSSRP